MVQAKNDTRSEAVYTFSEHDPELYKPSNFIKYIDSLQAADSESCVFDYRNQGYLGVAHAFDQKLVKAAIEDIDDLIFDRVPGFDGAMFEPQIDKPTEALAGEERRNAMRRVWRFVKHLAAERALRRMAEDPTLLRIIRRLMNGREPILMQDMALLKPPHVGSEKPWHQDLAYFDFDPSEPVVGVWIALDEATVTNGCMHLLTGGHKLGAVPHWKRRDWQICDAEIMGKPCVAAPLQPGGLLLFDAMMPHGTPTNYSGQSRRAIQYHYRPADAREITPARRLEIWGSEGKDVTC